MTDLSAMPSDVESEGQGQADAAAGVAASSRGGSEGEEGSGADGDDEAEAAEEGTRRRRGAGKGDSEMASAALGEAARGAGTPAKRSVSSKRGTSRSYIIAPKLAELEPEVRLRRRGFLQSARYCACEDACSRAVRIVLPCVLAIARVVVCGPAECRAAFPAAAATFFLVQALREGLVHELAGLEANKRKHMVRVSISISVSTVPSFVLWRCAPSVMSTAVATRLCLPPNCPDTQATCVSIHRYPFAVGRPGSRGAAQALRGGQPGRRGAEGAAGGGGDRQSGRGHHASARRRHPH